MGESVIANESGETNQSSVPLELSVAQAERLVSEGNGLVLIDTRSAGAFGLGHIPGALSVSQEGLAERIPSLTDEKDNPILLYCAVGVRSADAAQELRERGYRNACSLAGGYIAWRAAGYRTSSDSLIDVHLRERYSRNILLKEVGEQGQLRLMNGSVLLVGAGGLASSAALYLAASGVGTIGIVDFDSVEPSNLNRQVLHGVDTIGLPKVESARLAISRINPDVNVVPIPERFTPENALRLMDGFDVILDACDNVGTKYLLNDACHLAGKPYVFGGAVGFDGQAGVFWPKQGGPCLRCLFPKASAGNAGPTCSEAGVMGVVPGQIGLIQATEVIKLILKIGTPMIGRFYIYDALNLTSMMIETGRRSDCLLCGDKPQITAVSGEGSIEYEGAYCAG